MMKKLVPAFVTTALLGFGVASTAGCPVQGSEGEGEGAAGEGEGEGAAGEGEGEGAGEGEGEGGEGTIFDRIGGDSGVSDLIDDFVSIVLTDPNINGYFSNDTLDADRLFSCLNHEVAAATGKPGEVYPGITDANDTDDESSTLNPGGTVTCRSMLNAHAGLGISTNDFDDLITDFAQAMVDQGVADADQTAIAGVLGSLSGDIVEDETNDASIYQRLGRKPGIDTALAGPALDGGAGACAGDDCFVAKVLADAEINGFFANDPTLDAPRLVTCLERQVANATGGPEVYDHANPLVDGAALGGDNLVQCRSMLETHQNLQDGAGGNTGAHINIDDFNALVGDLNTVLTNLGVSDGDVTAIDGALGGTCGDIVTGGTGCP